MKQIFIFIFSLILLHGTVFAASMTESTCVEYFNNYRYDKASSCYSALLSNDKTNPSLRLGYGRSLFGLKKYSQAKEQFQQIIYSYPNSKISKSAQHYLDLTNDKLGDIKTSKKQDKGTYVEDITPKRWAYLPVKVYIQPCNYKSTVKKAFMEWQNKTEQAIRFEYVEKPEEANITVYFKKDIMKYGAKPTWVGLTNYNWNGRYLKSSQIYVKTTTSTGVIQTPSQVYEVCLHEIGHSIGIVGHSKNQYDVMYPSTDCYRNKLSNKDINTIKEMYSK